MPPQKGHSRDRVTWGATAALSRERILQIRSPERATPRDRRWLSWRRASKPSTPSGPAARKLPDRPPLPGEPLVEEDLPDRLAILEQDVEDRHVLPNGPGVLPVREDVAVFYVL